MFAEMIEENPENVPSLKLKEKVLFSLFNIISQHAEDLFVISLKEISVGFCFFKCELGVGKTDGEVEHRRFVGRYP